MAALKLNSFNWTSLRGALGETQKSMCNKKVEKQSLANLNKNHQVASFGALA